ncbi:hypothetical protein [Pectobacterium carotovorum]|uniref:hypothetical protein n=1 Tax=Pectobacterium carotovorum TaxID=554 RepID=UPI000D72F076|nr:hypothetical protein [Pectobacterium carotovorum]PXB02153.1 hypothetical protein DMB41_11305 [Pectobacterium carotovorum subsp. carotovorum]
MLNVKNIKMNKGVPVGQTHGRYPMTMHIDWMTVVSDYSCEDEKEIFEANMLLLKMKLKGEYNVTRRNMDTRSKKKPPYKNGLHISECGAGTPKLLSIYTSPRFKKVGGISIQIHPQHTTGERMDSLFNKLNATLDGLLFPILSRGWVTRVDIALDIYGCKLDDYYWWLNWAKAYEDFCEPYGLPGLQIGRKAALSLNLYEKIDASDAKIKGLKRAIFHVFDKNNHGKLRYRKERLIDLKKEQYPDLLRAEFRVQEKKNATGKYSKAGKVIMLSKLKSMKNPLQRLKVYKRALMSDMFNEWYKLGQPDTNCSKGVVNLLYRDKGGRLVRAAERIFERREVALFSANEVWSSWSDCVDAMGEVLAGLTGKSPASDGEKSQAKIERKKRRLSGDGSQRTRRR